MPGYSPKRSPYGIGQSEGIVSAFRTRTVASSAPYLIPYIQPDSRILDVGCGPGSITIDFARIAHEGHTTGVDTAAAVDTLQKARADARIAGISNVDFVIGDAHHLPFADGTFDIAHSHQVLQHVADPVAVLREMRRVTKRGGVVACCETDNDVLVYYPLYEGIEAYCRTFKDAIRARGLEPVSGRRVHAWARQAGFDPARMQTSTRNWVFRTPAERQVWGALNLEIVKKSEYAAVVVQHGLASAEALEEMKEAWRDWVVDEDGLAVIMNMELLCQV
ncbi:UbiE family methyltransferase [Phanerochaete sordida]|uniref:UbiE family methyltransferase n=1 Tax=Phanerochaete sordida TaxID=48140 RepID=A0A9P3FWM1_9APHY|nr:UbiE family methyltransferase [Phanerochaete sordida]